MSKKLVGFILSLVAVAAIGYSYKSANDSKQGDYTVSVAPDKEVFYESTYASYLEENNYQGDMSTSEVSVDLQNFTVDSNAEATVDSEGIITSEQGEITWEFEVDTPGFYNLEIGYIPVEGKNSSIERKIYLDDEIHFRGMEQVSLPREWVNETDTIESRNGGEIRPNTVEVMEQNYVFVEDSQKKVSEPYKFYLSQGTHKITFEAIKEPVKITNIEFKSATEPLAYEETINQLKEEYPLYEGEILVGQAERNEGITTDISKSTRSILINTNYASPQLEPSHPYETIFNTIGGDSWKTLGDAVTWEVEVPEAGLYQLSFTARQSANRGAISYRELLVNGELPFKEATSIGFQYSTEFKNYVVGDGTQAFFIPLEAGKNTITLETVLGEYDRAVSEVEESLLILNETYRAIVQLTGTVPDTYIDYEIEEKLPTVKTTFEQEYARLEAILENIIEVTGEKGQSALTIEKLVLQLERLAEDPELVVKELGQLSSNLGSLGLWNMEISTMPLEIDSLVLAPEGAELVRTEANMLESLWFEAQRFVSTFFNDATSISDNNADSAESVKVWIGTGKDQAQALMNLIEEQFTPATGIHVELELIPEGVIIPATLAGTGPDVVLGIGEASVMNFAIRNALVDLSEMDGFDELYTNYQASAFEGVTYQDAIYGIPEQQMFMMMFYREDILAELGLDLPKTWDEVRDMIPLLQMNNYDFYIPSGGGDLYNSLVFQEGGDLYLGEGNDYGIQTGLYSDAAMSAFKDYTQFFTSYHLPVAADFSNRFRTGEIPIGIFGYTEYAKLQVFAPEIRGLWGFAPIPGTEQEDGSIDNTLISTSTQTLMLKDAKNKEASWEFMQWWASEEVQLQYANTLESIMGTAARYASANIGVIEQLPWTVADIEALTEQLASTKGIPEIPGGYMTLRQVGYAFKNVVTDGQNPREALYLNAKPIDDELTKKREEFDLSTVEPNN